MIASEDRAPNEAAHRLAWWMGTDPDDAIAALVAAGVAPGLIDRMLLGHVVPADEQAAAIAVATGGAVLPADWTVPSDAEWGDRPAPRPEGATA